MKRYLVDTNLVVRFLTGEPEGQAARVRELFKANESGDIAIKLVPLVVAENVSHEAAKTRRNRFP